MDFKDFVTGKDDEGRRLDKVLKILVPTLNLSNLYKSLRKGLIKVNDKKADPSYKICLNDKISIATILLDQTGNQNDNNTQKSNLDYSFIKEIIVFENEHFLFLNKPAGLSVQKADKNEPALDDYVKTYLSDKEKTDSLSFRTGPLHRLDKNTCGLVCFSKSLAGAKWFSEQLQNNTIKKEYIGVVQGKLEQNMEWIDYISNSKPGSKKEFQTVKVSDTPLPGAKKAITQVYPVETKIIDGNTISYVKFNIQTGRHHQIRAQSSYHGFPLINDTVYNGQKTSFNNGKYYLCACKLEFPQNELGLPATLSLK